MKTEPRHVVIVGAGPGGLAAALLLAKSGVRVTIVEKRNGVGGRTSTLEQDGFRFDIGPTFFLYPRVLKEIFAVAGYDLDREVPMTRLDPQYRLVFGAGGQLLATPDVARMEREIAAISPEDARRFHVFITHNRLKLESFLPFLQSPFESWKDLLKPEMTARTLAVARSIPADAFQGRANPSRLLLPIQVPRHEPVPLPKPLFDPLFPGV